MLQSQNLRVHLIRYGVIFFFAFLLVVITVLAKLFVNNFIYTILIERAIHNSMCSNALIHTLKVYTTVHVYNNKSYLILCAIKSS